MKRILTAIVLSLVTTAAFSQTQMEMNQEAAEKYKKVDTELNQVYKELLALLRPERKTLLVKAQRAWIAYRDAHCQYESSVYEGGSLQPLLTSMCMRDLTEGRLRQLQAAKKAAQEN